MCGRPIIKREMIENVTDLKNKLMGDVHSGVLSAKAFLAEKLSLVKDYWRQQDPSDAARELKHVKVRGNDDKSKAEKAHRAPKRQKADAPEALPFPLICLVVFFTLTFCCLGCYALLFRPCEKGKDLKEKKKKNKKTKKCLKKLAKIFF